MKKKTIPKVNKIKHKRDLTTRERLALFLYIKGKETNLSKAMRDAGYRPEFAAMSGVRLLQNPKSQEFLSRYREKALKKYSKTADDVLSEVALIAFSDLNCFFKQGDNGLAIPKTLKEMGEYSKCVKRIKQFRREHYNDAGEITHVDSTFDLELYDKLKAQAMLSMHHGIGKVDQSNDGGTQALPQILLPDNGRTGKVAVFVEYGEQ